MKKINVMRIVIFCILLSLLFNHLAVVSASAAFNAQTVHCIESYVAQDPTSVEDMEPMFIWKAPTLIIAAGRMLSATAISVGLVGKSHLFRNPSGANAVKFVPTGKTTYTAYSYKFVNGTFVRMTVSPWHWDIQDGHDSIWPY